MKRISTAYSFTIYVCLTLFSLSANARENWEKYNATSSAVYYLDLNSIHQKAGVVSYQTLINFQKPGTPTYSTTAQYEMKCSSKEIKFVKMTNYSEVFGSGQIVGVITPATVGLDSSKFYPVDSGSELVKQFNFVCK